MKKALKIIGGIIMGICTLIVVLAVVTPSQKEESVQVNKQTAKQAPPIVEKVDYTQLVSIEDMDIQVTEGTTRGKAYIKIKNNSNKTLNYVRADIYFYDKEGNVVGSTYTNSGSSFLVGATQVLDRYITWENNYDGYKVIITDAK